MLVCSGEEKGQVSYWGANTMPLACSPTLNISVIVFGAYEFSGEDLVRSNLIIA